MQKTTKFRALSTGALIITAALGLTACAAPAGSAADSGANEADVMFVQMMIPHHEGAVEMSDVLLDKTGVDPDVVAIAEQIKAAQAPEIEQMEAWLEEWDVDMSDMSGMDGMEGMDPGDMGGMGDMSEDMDALEEADGAAAGDLFLEQMIVHHEGAIDMAEDVLEDGEHPDVRELAENIVESQADEIERMRSMLES
ncbi:DUF305 domain-containing protein [Microcella flavibacter]|uniref:DUF305 domain-containing protein n=1 Tax=Microcella flavibacter TaxID=1804990 RepID=UPI001457737F|nr:DUF305 domain-containing protein [Microcella flavibacter]